MRTFLIICAMTLFLTGCNHAGYYQTRTPPPQVQPYYLPQPQQYQMYNPPAQFSTPQQPIHVYVH